MTTDPPSTPPPSPVGVTDEAAFVAELRRLRAWSGLSFRQLERRASATGDTLPYSTAATMLGRNRLPREELLVAFLRACGLDEGERQHWVTARAAIVDGTALAPVVGPIPSFRRHTPSRWRPALVAAATAAIAFTCGAALASGGSIEDREIVVIAP